MAPSAIEGTHHGFSTAEQEHKTDNDLDRRHLLHHGWSPQSVALAVIGAALFGDALASFRVTSGTMA